MPTSKKRACFYCNGTGKYKKPLDEDAFDKRFEHYDSMACFISMGEMREKALKDVGYTLIDCPCCGGTGIVQD